MLTLAVGGLYVAEDAVRQALAPVAEVQRMILDLGTSIASLSAC